MNSFRNKIVYIIGGSSGIGLAAAKLFAAQGARVFIFARRKDVLEEAVQLIDTAGAAFGMRHGCRALDITDDKQVASSMKKSVSEFGVPDILINCAGRAYPRYFDDISYEQFDETMKVNLYGTRNVIAALLPFMKERGGHIVNVASIAGFVGVFGYTDYSASKFGVMGFSEVLRSELKHHGIAVTVLCPPDTDTPGFQTENMTKPDETRAVSQGAKIMGPDEVAGVLLRGIEKKKALVIPGFDGKLTYLMKRFFPWVVDMVMDSSIRKARPLKR